MRLLMRLLIRQFVELFIRIFVRLLMRLLKSLLVGQFKRPITRMLHWRASHWQFTGIQFQRSSTVRIQTSRILRNCVIKVALEFSKAERSFLKSLTGRAFPLVALEKWTQLSSANSISRAKATREFLFLFQNLCSVK